MHQKMEERLDAALEEAKEDLKSTATDDYSTMVAAIAVSLAWTERFASLMATDRFKLTPEEMSMFGHLSVKSMALNEITMERHK